MTEEHLCFFFGEKTPEQLKAIYEITKEAERKHALCRAARKHIFERMTGARGELGYFQCTVCSQATCFPEMQNQRLLEDE